MAIIQGGKHQRIEVERNGRAVRIAALDRHGPRALNIFPECLRPLANELMRLADELDKAATGESPVRDTSTSQENPTLNS